MNIAVQKSVYGGSQFIFLYVSFTPVSSRIIYTIPSLVTPPYTTGHFVV